MKDNKFRYRQTLVTFLWQFCLFLLTLNIGASIIQAFENNGRSTNTKKYTQDEIVENFSQFYNISAKSVNQMLKSIEAVTSRNNKQISYVESLIFTMSLFFTIGWGHVVPQTIGCKISCMVITLIGIPLTFLTIFTGAKIFLQVVKDVLLIVCSHHYNKKLSKYGQRRLNKATNKYLFPTCLSLIVLYIFLSAVLVGQVEDFSYFEALWHCYVSFTTIGLGAVSKPMIFETSGVRLFGLTSFIFVWLILGFIMVVGTAVIISKTKTIKLREKQIFSFEKSMNEEALLANCNDNGNGNGNDNLTSYQHMSPEITSIM